MGEAVGEAVGKPYEKKTLFTKRINSPYAETWLKHGENFKHVWFQNFYVN